jgi:CheY-like chemotaxis protein
VQLWSEAGLLRAWKTPGGHRRIPDVLVDDRRAAEPESVGAHRLLEARGAIEQQEDLQDDTRIRWAHGDQVRRCHTCRRDRELIARVRDRVSDRCANADVALTAIHIDGFEMRRALKASGAMSELEIIVVTALTEHTIAERGGLPEGVTVLFKPLRFADLRLRLAQLVEHWQRLAAG